MKKILSIAVAALAGAAIAETVSVADVGITAVQTSLQNTIVAVPYESLRGITSGTIAVSDVVKTYGVPENTILYAYDATQNKYYAWAISEGAWTPTTIATKTETRPAGDQPSASYTVSTGNAIWLCLASEPVSPVTFYLYGQYVVPGSVSFAAGRNLVANITQSDVSNLASRITGAQNGDMIIAPNGTIYTKGRRGWVNGESLGLPTIAAGQGFWYIAKGSGSINWGTL